MYWVEKSGPRHWLVKYSRFGANSDIVGEHATRRAAHAHLDRLNSKLPVSDGPYPLVCFTQCDDYIQLVQTDLNRFTTVYGKQVIEDLTYSQAAANLGSIIMHAAACDGLLNNEGPDDNA